jgi:REP element-mobilizing transposase RayT
MPQRRAPSDHTLWRWTASTTLYGLRKIGSRSLGDVGQRCRELIRETARGHEMVIHAGSINRDHVHLLLSIPPSLSVSRAVQYQKGRSSP